MRRTSSAVALALALLVAGAGAWADDLGVTVPNTFEGVEAPALTGWLRLPAGAGPFPAVVLMHGCAGLTDAVRAGLEAHAAFLVGHGYAALILDSFEPRGLAGGAVCRSTSKLGAAAWYRVHDAFNALRYLRGRPEIDGDRVFLLGQSNGGTVALNAARRRGQRHTGAEESFAGVIAYYPYCAGLDDMTTRTLILIGADDDWTPAAPCQTAARFDGDGLIEVVVYPGAVHSFDLPIARQEFAGHLVGGDTVATEHSRARMLYFLAAN